MSVFRFKVSGRGLALWMLKFWISCLHLKLESCLFKSQLLSKIITVPATAPPSSPGCSPHVRTAGHICSPARHRPLFPAASPTLMWGDSDWDHGSHPAGFLLMKTVWNLSPQAFPVTMGSAHLVCKGPHFFDFERQIISAPATQLCPVVKSSHRQYASKQQ